MLEFGELGVKFRILQLGDLTSQSLSFHPQNGAL